MDREPYAYWKGNPAVAVTRQELLNCNVSDKQDWNARVYIQVPSSLSASVFIFNHTHHILDNNMDYSS